MLDDLVTKLVVVVVIMTILPVSQAFSVSASWDGLFIVAVVV